MWGWAWWAWWVGCGGRSGPTPCDPPGTQVTAPRAAGCVVVVDGQLLLVQNTAGKWSIPGGYLDGAEDSAAAAARETWEEAHVRVRAGAPACAVPATRFVAHWCTPDGHAAPTGDGSETRDARFFGREALEALPRDQLRFPDQWGSYLRFVDHPGP